MAEPGARELQPGDRFVVAGHKRQADVVTLRQPRQQVPNSGQDAIGERRRTQLRVRATALLAHVGGALVDPQRRDSRLQQQPARDLAVGPAGRRQWPRQARRVDPVDLEQRRVQRVAMRGRGAPEQRPVDVE